MRDTAQMRSKQRKTIMVWANSDGIHKLPLFYMDKPKNPLFFHIFSTKLHPLCIREERVNGQTMHAYMIVDVVQCHERTLRRPWLLLLDNFTEHEELLALAK